MTFILRSMSRKCNAVYVYENMKHLQKEYFNYKKYILHDPQKDGVGHCRCAD
jgi:hypothetical protein